MVELVIKGVKEIVILDEIAFRTAEEFFKDTALGHPPGEIPVNWANGVIFIHASLPWNEVTTREYAEHGRIYWSYIKYAPMKEYREKVVEGNVIFRIRKTRVPTLIEVAEKLRERLGLEG